MEPTPLDSEAANLHARITAALGLILNYGGIDGAHHKQWLLDRIVLALCETDDQYQKWVATFAAGDYAWDRGIAP